ISQLDANARISSVSIGDQLHLKGARICEPPRPLRLSKRHAASGFEFQWRRSECRDLRVHQAVLGDVGIGAVVRLGEEIRVRDPLDIDRVADLLHDLSSELESVQSCWVWLAKAFKERAYSGSTDDVIRCASAWQEQMHRLRVLRHQALDTAVVQRINVFRDHGLRRRLSLELLRVPLLCECYCRARSCEHADHRDHQENLSHVASYNPRPPATDDSCTAMIENQESIFLLR